MNQHYGNNDELVRGSVQTIRNDDEAEEGADHWERADNEQEEQAESKVDLLDDLAVEDY